MPWLSKVFIRFISEFSMAITLTLYCRLLANDRVDPYVSVYECPVPSYVGDITHLQWKGFLGPEFVQSVINTGLYGMRPYKSTNAIRLMKFLMQRFGQCSFCCYHYDRDQAVHCCCVTWPLFVACFVRLTFHMDGNSFSNGNSRKITKRGWGRYMVFTCSA